MANLLCLVCSRELPPGTEPSGQVCGVCAGSLGIAALPPARRAAKPCQQCQGKSFIRAIPRELDSSFDLERSGIRHSPMYVTYEPHSPGPLVAPQIAPTDGRGTLEMYICKHCGFVEWFCLNPQRIPIGVQFMTESIDYDSAPYR